MLIKECFFFSFLLSCSLEPIKDLIPFFLCKLGQFSSALTNLFPKTEVPNSRLTPTTFLLYLRIFETASAPDLVAIKPEHLCYPGASWAPIKGRIVVICLEQNMFYYY